MILLNSIQYDKEDVNENDFPFVVPLINNLDKIEFNAAVTIIVGENGTGKSTLLESIAAAVDSIVVGAESMKSDKTLAHARLLGKHFKLSWRQKTKRGFFMRSEDFFNFTRKMNEMRQDMLSELQRVNNEYNNRSQFAQKQARTAFESSLHGIEGRYGENLDACSHGESFLNLFQSRFVPKGLYILDEPEAPLSPLRQYSFMMLLKKMVEENSQFIIATHSPILMAYPGAEIFSCDSDKLHKVKYNELDHVNFTREFLNNPDSYLRRI